MVKKQPDQTVLQTHPSPQKVWPYKAFAQEYVLIRNMQLHRNTYMINSVVLRDSTLHVPSVDVCSSTQQPSSAAYLPLLNVICGSLNQIACNTGYEVRTILP